MTSEGDSVRIIVHWQGGDHTELRLKKTPTGRHSRVTRRRHDRVDHLHWLACSATSASQQRSIAWGTARRTNRPGLLREYVRSATVMASRPTAKASAKSAAS